MVTDLKADCGLQKMSAPGSCPLMLHLPPKRHFLLGDCPCLDSPPVPRPQVHLDEHVPLGTPARGGGHPTRLYGCREHPGELKSNKNV